MKKMPLYRVFILLLLSSFVPPAAVFGQAGAVRQVQIGVNIEEVDHPESRRLAVAATEGAAITKVFPNSSAERAGLKAGDVVVKCGARKIANCDDLRSVILGSSPGNKHRVEFYRGRQLLFVDLVVGRAPQPGGQTTVAVDRRPYIGMRAVSAGTASARRMGIESPQGAAVESVVPGGPAAKAGFQRGDLIVDFGRQPITNYDDVAAALSRSPIGSRQRVFFVRHNQRHETTLVIGWRAGNALKPADNNDKKPGPSEISSSPPQPPQPVTPPVSIDPPQTPPEGWITKTIGEVTVSVPPDWTASEFAPADEAVWFKGSELLPEVSFTVCRDTSLTELSRGGAIKSKTEVRIDGRIAEQVVVEKRDDVRSEKGLIIVLKGRGSGEGSVALVGFVAADQWDRYEPVFRQIVRCVRIGQK